MILKGISILPKVRKTKGYDGVYNRLYHTKEWKAFRHHYLLKHPLCAICDGQGKVAPATVLDHIQPIRQGGSVWKEYNLQGLCKSCNARKTALDNHNNHD